MIRLVPRVCLLAAPLATTLSAQPTPIPQHLVFTPYRVSGIYDVGDTVGWTVTPATSPPTYALGADTNGDLHGRKAGYPDWRSDDPAVMKTALYFDPVNVASRIKAPVLAGIGFIDTISPPAGTWTMLNHIRRSVEALPMIESEHDNLTPDEGRICPARTNEILDVVRRGGSFMPRALE